MTIRVIASRVFFSRLYSSNGRAVVMVVVEGSPRHEHPVDQFRGQMVKGQGHRTR